MPAAGTVRWPLEPEPTASSVDERRQAYVQPGHIYVSAEPAEATTVLGSCVAVCLWNARLRCGGINHFLLPESAAGASSSSRFGNVAMELLVQRMLALGSRSQDLSAKLFGGAAVIDAFRGGEGHLGARNVSVARRLLATHGIPVVAEDVLGSHGRKLLFHTATGIALVRLL